MALTDQGRQLRSYSLTSGASVSLDNVVIHTDHLNRVTRARRAASGPPLGRSRRRTPSRHLHPSGRCSWVVTDPHDLSSRGRGLRQPGTGMLMSLVVRARAGNGTAELSRIAGALGVHAGPEDEHRVRAAAAHSRTRPDGRAAGEQAAGRATSVSLSSTRRTGRRLRTMRSRQSRTGRFLAIVATPELFGSCDGSWSGGSGAADGEAGVVHAVDRAGHLERGGLPDRRRESADREALATRARPLEP